MDTNMTYLASVSQCGDITVAEACVLYNLARQTVMLAIAQGRVEARRTIVGRLWLIDSASAESAWGRRRDEHAYRKMLAFRGANGPADRKEGGAQ